MRVRDGTPGKARGRSASDVKLSESRLSDIRTVCWDPTGCSGSSGRQLTAAGAGRVFTWPTGLKTIHTNPSVVDEGVPTFLSCTLTLLCRRMNLRFEKTCQKGSAGLWLGVPAGWRPPRDRGHTSPLLEPQHPHLSTVDADGMLYHIQGL